MMWEFVYACRKYFENSRKDMKTEQFFDEYETKAFIPE